MHQAFVAEVNPLFHMYISGWWVFYDGAILVLLDAGEA